MKKITAILSVLILAISINVSAQTGGLHVVAGDVNGDGVEVTKVGPGQLILSGANLKEGTNRLQPKELNGTLTFVKKGNNISDVVFTDKAGKTTRLTPTSGGTNGAPKPECKTKLPDLCFGTANKNIGLCICKPDNLSNGGGEWNGATFKIYQRVSL